MGVLTRTRSQSYWESKNLILGVSEVGFEDETGKSKIGDGITRWNALPYSSYSAFLIPQAVFESVSPEGVATGISASHDTDAERETFIPSRLSDAALKAAYTSPPRVHTDFRIRSNGIPAAGDEGLVFVPNPATGAPAPTVTSGVLVSGVDGVTNKASYLQQSLGANVHRLGAEFVFGAGADDGSITLVAWSTIIPTPYAAPDSPCHLTITPLGWTYMYWSGAVSTQIGSGTFITPLAQDGTVHRVEVQFRGGTAHLLLPDGTTAQVTDSHIASIAAPISCHEIFKNSAGSATAGFTRIWADSDPNPLGFATPAEIARSINRAPFLAAPSTAKYAPASYAGVPVPASMTLVNEALTVPVTVPPSGKLLIELSAWLTIGSAATVYWAVANGATYLCWRTVSINTYDGPRALQHLATGLTPGTVMTPEWRHMATVASGGNVMWLDASAGYEATMSITPVN